MTHRQDVARGRDIVARWCSLAEQRLGHLTELFESGRWRRYHSEVVFLENIREARAAVETWRNLLTREASRENYALDVSWLGRARTTSQRDAPSHRAHPFSPQPTALTCEPARPVAPEVIRVPSGETHSMPTAAAAVFEPKAQSVTAMIPEPQPVLDSTSVRTLDIISAIQERYPLLRNAL